MLYSTASHVPPRRAASLLAALGALLPRRRPRPSNSRRVLKPWRDDAYHTYPTTGFAPSHVAKLIKSADAGFPQGLFELYEEMLAKWPRLAAVEATRRLALTGLEWELAGPDPRIADFCRGALERIASFRAALDHLATAIGHGIAICELVWEDGDLIDIVPVPYSRIIADAHEPWRLRIRTEADPTDGVAIDEQPLKWLIHEPRPTPGRPLSGGLLRASLPLFVAQHFSLKQWLIYSEIAGMPVRFAQYDPNMPEAEKKELDRMLQALGTDAWAAFSRNVDVTLLEARSSGDKPYEPLQDHCNTEVTILWLGQHLTTDIKSSGSRAAAEIHDRVRDDLLVDDIKTEGETVRRGLLAPLVAARFGESVESPRFRRSLIESVDTKVLAETLAVAVRDLSTRVCRPAGRTG